MTMDPSGRHSQLVARLDQLGFLDLAGFAWSPDGTRFAMGGVLRENANKSAVFVMNIDGSGLRQLTHDGLSYWPQWSPEGTQLAFVGHGGITMVNPDGSGERRLGVGATVQDGLSWNPLPRQSATLTTGPAPG